MSDENSVNSTPLDHGIDQNVRVKQVQDEKYVKSLDGSKVALDHNPLTDTSPTENRSWTMSEIERAIISQVIPGTKQKLAQYGVGLTRRNDFRLRELTRRLESQLKQDFSKDIETGSSPARIRPFDLQSQSMRMITANAALSSLQFQKTQVLPFMRKSLALNYEKTNLLKRVVGGIDSLEKAVVAKLEAIKMNTAAAVPSKTSLFKQLRMAIRAKNIDRVAGNFSNLTMDTYDENYKKFVSPVLKKLNKTMSDGSSSGGFNGVSRKVTEKLNAVRRDANRFASSQSADPSFLGKVKQTGAGLVAGVLSGAVRFGQKNKLSEGKNQFVSKHLSEWTNRIDGFNPFAGNREREQRNLGFPSLLENSNSSSFDSLTQLVREWRDESRVQHDRLIDHVDAVGHSLSSPSKPFRLLTKDKFSKTLVASKSPSNLPGYKSPTVSWNIGPNSEGQSSFSSDKTTNMFRSLFGSLSNKLEAINTSILSTGKDRSKFEKSQTKRQTVLDKLTDKAKIRKGSYEDLLEQRKSKISVPTLKSAGAATLGVDALEALKSLWSSKDKDDDGDDSSLLSDATDLISDQFGDGDGGEEGEGKSAKKKTGTKGRAKKGWRRRFGKAGRRKFFGRFGRKAAASVPTSSKSLTRRLAGGLFRGSKGLVKGGFKGAWGLSKFGGRGALALAKSGVGKGLIGAGVSMLGQKLWDQSGATGGVKKAGDTAISMASYGSMGATVGSLFGGIGAVPGAMIGAAVGGLVANADYASGQFSAIGSKIGNAGKFFWTGLVGQNAKVRSDGTVIQQKKSSILEDVKIAFFGRKAQYSSTGEVITTERSNLIGGIKYGFEKLMFGDKYTNGEYKEGTSLIDIAKDGTRKAFVSFGKQLAALPGQIKEGFSSAVLGTAKLMEKAYDKTEKSVYATGRFVNKSWDKTKSGYRSADKSFQQWQLDVVSGTKNATQNFTWKGLGQGLIKAAPYFMSPNTFITGASAAIFGWGVETKKFTNPSSPFYAFASESLDAYGLKNHDMYLYIHSLETSQEKINAGSIKPFDDADMEYMAGRFGFDTKNKEAVNYFKMWYKSRFSPAMAIIGKVLKSHQLTFASILGADEQQIVKVTEDLKKAIAGSSIKSLGLEPTVQAYNKYAKISGRDPGGTNPANTLKAQAFDPRDPKNKNTNPASQPYRVGGSRFDNPTWLGGGGEAVQRAAKKNAAMAKGEIKDQPEYKDALQKLPPKLRQIIDKRKALQFALWSTSVQHGPDTASQIFQRSYTEGMDERSYVRSIYQDRATRFQNLGSEDRIEAMGHIGQEQSFIEDLWGGRVKDNDMVAMGRQISNVVDPTGIAPKAFRTKKVKPITPSVKEHLVSAAQKLGVSPVELAGLASYESVGTFNPAITGGAGNRYQGIFQFGPAEQRKYGVNNTSSAEQQLDAFVKFAFDRKYRPGMGWQKLYTTINGGNPNVSVHASDGNGTQLDHYRNIQKQHFAHAAFWLQGGNSTGAQGSNQTPPNSPPPPAKSPQKSASPAPSGNTSAPPKPAARPQQQSKPTPTPKAPPKPETHDMGAWSSALAGALEKHTSALDANTKAKSAPHPKTPNGVSVNPLFLQSPSGKSGFLSMSMKKAQLAVGNEY